MTRHLALLPTAHQHELAEGCGPSRTAATATAQLASGQLVFLLESLLVAVRPAAPAAPVPLALPEYETVAEFAARLGVSQKTVRRMLGSGLPHERPRPRLIRIPVDRAQRWIAEQTAIGNVETAQRRATIDARRKASR